MKSIAMSHFVFAVCALSCVLSSSQARADNCKPDVSRIDKITKQQQDIWTQKVGGTGFGASLMGSKDVAVFVTIGRYGNVNAVNVEILKEEASAASASFDSSLRAVKGNRFFLGFKEGGEPLSFVATDVGNETKVRNDVLDFGNGKVVTSVVLSSALSDEALATMRDAITTKQIDAIRVLLVGDLRVEYSLEEKTSKKLMAKFLCFFDAMDKRGLSRTASQGQAVSQPPLTNDPARMAAVQGRYSRKGKPTDFMELNADGTAGLRQDGHSVRGNYTVNGDAIAFTSPQMPGLTSRGHVTADTIKDDEGIIWEKMTEAQRAAAPPLPDEPTPSKDAATSALGKYVLKGGTWYMELKADGTVECQLSATKPCSGTYRLAGPGVALKLNVGSTNMKIVGNTLVGKTQIWEKQLEAPRAEAPRATTHSTTTVTLRLGMTPEEVEAAQGGKPQKVIDLGSKKTYIYPDMKIVFVDGKVTDIQ
jgi:hypothetical protein